MEIPLSLFILGSLAIIGIIIGIWNYIQAKRVAALKIAAVEMGFSYEKEDSSLLSKDFENFQFFKRARGSFKKTYNVFKGNWNGLSTLIFDYDWSTRKHNSRPDVLETVIAFQLEGNALPKNYELIELNTTLLDSTLNLETTELLKKMKPSDSWLIESNDKWLILCRTYGIADQRVRSTKLKEYLQEACQIHRALRSS